VGPYGSCLAHSTPYIACLSSQPSPFPDTALIRASAAALELDDTLGLVFDLALVSLVFVRGLSECTSRH
jgi:hypothetical protein